MVYDTLANATWYFGLHERFKAGFQWLTTTDLSTLENGKFEIRGQDISAVVNRYETKPIDAGKWESHRKYADIQYVVSGEDIIHWSPLHLAKLGNYIPEKDLQELTVAPAQALLVKAGEFAIFLPQDAHKPGLTNGQPTTVYKIVLKIRIDDI